MKVIVKAKFSARKKEIEKMGDNRYLIYLPFEEDEDATLMLRHVLSRYMGTPVGRVEFSGKDSNNDWVFEIR